MDTIQSQLKTINCTKCSAPLDLQGGRQVKSISCPYCKSLLDNKNKYKIVDRFLKVKRPNTLLKIGQKGVLKEINFTVIGFIAYKSEGDRWIEYQLFSPTHGYAWLSHEAEEGCFVFGHKVRYYPESYSNQKGSTFIVNNRTFVVNEVYIARVYFVEGELTWIAHKNKKISILEAASGSYIYSIETTKKEEEYSLGEELKDSEVFKAFGISNFTKKLEKIGISNFTKKLEKIKEKLMVAILMSIPFLGLWLLIIMFKFADEHGSSSSSSSSIRSGSTHSSSSSSSSYSSSSYSGGK